MSLAPEVVPEVTIPLRARGLRVVPSVPPERHTRPSPAVSPTPPVRIPTVPGASGATRPASLVRSPRPGLGPFGERAVEPGPAVVPVAFTPSQPLPTAPSPIGPGRSRSGDDTGDTGDTADTDDTETSGAGHRVIALSPLRASASADLEGRDDVGLRLTRRGRAALALAAVALAIAVVLGAWLSGPATSGEHGVAGTGPEQVIVHDGDTLWSIASRVAPQRDPRAEVADLVRLNALEFGALHPGQVLRLR